MMLADGDVLGFEHTQVRDVVCAGPAAPALQLGAAFVELALRAREDDQQQPSRRDARSRRLRPEHEPRGQQRPKRLRKRYGELLRMEISQTVASPGDVEEEIRSLLAVL